MCVCVTPGFALLHPGLPLFNPFGVILIDGQTSCPSYKLSTSCYCEHVVSILTVCVLGCAKMDSRLRGNDNGERELQNGGDIGIVGSGFQLRACWNDSAGGGDPSSLKLRGDREYGWRGVEIVGFEIRSTSGFGPSLRMTIWGGERQEQPRPKTGAKLSQAWPAI